MTTKRLPTCAILVLNWNGIPHLRHLLPSLRAAAVTMPGSVALVLVDNCSTEPDVEWTRTEFSDVEVVVAQRNDFLFSLNPVVAARREDVVVILNNDMRVDPGFLGPLLEHFADPSVFAATANVLDWDGSRNTTGQRLMKVRHGWLYQWWAPQPQEPTFTLYAGGGCAVFRRQFFTALGGFDPLYRPAYFEDVDLSYRAWMRGWRTVYEPRSIIYHRIGATLWTPEREARMQRLLARNEALCTLKNVGGWPAAVGFLGLLPIRAVRSWWRGDRAGAAGMWASLARAGHALLGRARAPRPVLSAAQISAALMAGVDGTRSESRRRGVVSVESAGSPAGV